MSAKNTSSSSEPGLSRKAVSPFSARRPRCTYMVASPPSSRIMFGKPPPCQSNMRAV